MKEKHLDHLAHTLDSLLFSLLDIIRGSGASGPHAWVEVISLLALKVLVDRDVPDGRGRTEPDALIGERWASSLNPSLQPARVEDSIMRLASTVEREHPALTGVFTQTLLTSLSRFQHRVVLDLVLRLSHFSASSVDPLAFGRWFDSKLNSLPQTGRDSTEHTTPPTVATLMVELACIEDALSVLDPCCGTGGTLAQAGAKHTAVKLFGQEINTLAWAMARLRLFLLGHDVNGIVVGDVLRDPAFTTHGTLQRFDAVFCDAPLGLTLRDPEFAIHDPYARFIFGAPGRGSADGAFLQHALRSLKPGGTGLAVVSHGFLFRSGADGRIREGMIQSGCIEAVIGLPGKLRAESAIETALIVFGSRTAAPHHILFIDASGIQPGGRGRIDLSGDTIQQIASVFRSKEGRPGLSHVATIEEIRSSEYSLLPRRYVSPVDHVREKRDINELRTEVLALESRHQQAVREMETLLDELASSQG